LPVALDENYLLVYGEQNIAVRNKTTGETKAIEWVHDLLNVDANGSGGTRFALEPPRWDDVNIVHGARVTVATDGTPKQTSTLEHSSFVIVPNSVDYDGKTWKRVVQVTRDPYGYWGLYYYLIDCKSAKAIDLNCGDMYLGMEYEMDAVWVEHNTLVGNRFSNDAPMYDCTMLYSRENLTPLAEQQILRRCGFCGLTHSIRGIHVFCHDLESAFSPRRFIDEVLQSNK
jgi:hypothetical protein